MLPESLPTQSDSNSHHSHHGQTWRICYHNLMSSSNVSVARWTPPKKNTAFGHPDPAGPPTTRHCQHLPWWTAIRFCWLYQHPGAKGKLGTFLQRKMEKSINLLLCQDVDIVKDIYIYIMCILMILRWTSGKNKGKWILDIYTSCCNQFSKKSTWNL